MLASIKSTRFVPISRHLAPVRWRIIYLQMQSRNRRRSLAIKLNFSSYISATRFSSARRVGNAGDSLLGWARRVSERERKKAYTKLVTNNGKTSLSCLCGWSQGRMAKKSSLSKHLWNETEASHIHMRASLFRSAGWMGVCFYEPGADWPRAHVR